MFNKTGKQLKIVGKEITSIFKAIKNDVCQELQLSKQARAFKKDLRAKQNSSEDASTHTREEAQT